MVAVEMKRMLRLAEQCLERAKSFIENHFDPPDLPTSSPSLPLPSLSEPNQPPVSPAASAANIGEYVLLLSGVLFINTPFNPC